MRDSRQPLRLWVDVTVLLAWKGKPTGIPRVAASILQEWLACPTLNLGLCHFNAGLRDLQEISRAAFQATIAANQVAPSEQLTGGQKSVPPNPVPSLPRRLLHRVKRLAAYLPRPIKAPLKWTWRGLRAARRALRQGLRGSRGQAPVQKPLPLGPGDLVVCLGGSWGVPDFPRLLWCRKQRDGFRYYELIHDLIPCKFPQFFQSTFPSHFEGWLADLLWTADLVGADSENTRRDVAWFASQTGCPLPASHLLRLGDDVASAEPATRPPASCFAVDGPFVLAVGTLEVRKNHQLLYHVWRRLIEEHGAAVPPLVIVGRLGWLCQDLLYQLQEDPVVRGRVLLLSEVSDAELNWLYQNCLFLMYPSYYEGWGLPIAEGLARGKFCIASSASSIPEIGGDLVDYHDPVDFRACHRLALRALFDAEYRRERERQVRLRYQPTTWGQSATGLLATLEQHFGSLHVQEGSLEAAA